MLDSSELPSVRRFALELWEATEEGVLAVLACPSSACGSRWVDAVLDAFGRISAERGDPSPVRLDHVPSESDDPVKALALGLDLEGEPSVAGLLESFGREPVCILVLNCQDRLSAAWRRLIADFARQARALGVETRLRPFLIVVTGCVEYPPVDFAVGIKVRAIWNAVRWEEVRLLVESGLATNENSLARTWRLSVYCATSNGDPEVAAMLCRELPNSIAESVELGLASRTCGKQVRLEQAIPLVADQRWDAPVAAVSQWAAGRLIGSTLERGPCYNLEHLQEGAARVYLLMAIWREQIAGLLPVLMEMGFSLNAAVTNVIGEGWMDGVPAEQRGPGGQVSLEPSEIVERIKTRSSGRVPDSLWNLLQLLRVTRNDLAHMRSVEYGRIRELWHGYDMVRKRFESSVNSERQSGSNVSRGTAVKL